MFVCKLHYQHGGSFLRPQQRCLLSLPQLPVCFEKSSRFTIKKQRESKKKGAQTEVPLYVFFMYFYLIVARFGACQGQSKGKRRTRLPSEFMALF